MAYTEHFQHADDVAAHLSQTITNKLDPLLVMKFMGFLSIAGVTVYELAIKDILIEFSRQKDEAFGNYVTSDMDRRNGRIKLGEVRQDWKKFGKTYESRFNSDLRCTSDEYLRTKRQDIPTSYGNLITWRNEFAHAGRIKTAQTTFPEVVQSYEAGKQVIHCLNRTLC